MKASDIGLFHPKFKKTDWPEGVLDLIDARVLTDLVFPLRQESGIPMWPSAYFDAHVRKTGSSMHSIEKTGLSNATDIHCKTISQMIQLMDLAESMPKVGGVGIYFDTYTPMIHLDRFDVRGKKLTWIRTKASDYVYKQSHPIEFYRTLAHQLELKGL